ncbi:MAG TPA: pyrroline-5-carboxylate reductase [Alphaproteobacteria bacterium]
MTRDTPSLLLVGCGKMGGALLAGWIERRIADAIAVIEPSPEAVAPFRGRAGVTLYDDLRSLPPGLAPDIVVFATKPQGIEAVVPGYRRFAPDALFLSIAAGKTIASFEAMLGGNAAIVRAMPNTPAQVGRGITVACANARVNAVQRRFAGALLAAVGAVEWVDDERLMDAVTAVSGSGPAYVFLLAECLAEAGIKAGLPADLAATLARATVAGAGELLHRAPEPAAVLRKNVTSPGGTTAAALEVLMGAQGLQPLLTAAVAAATRRSRELAG